MVKPAMLRLAVLGLCPETRPLLQAASGSAGWQIVAVLQADPDDASPRELAPHARTGRDWESMLVGDPVDAVLIAHPSHLEQTDEILKRVAQEGVPALVLHPACEAILAYELEMILRDSRGLLLPYFPGIDHPAVDRMRALRSPDSDGPIGTIQQLTWERSSVAHGPVTLTDWFVRDMHLTRRLVGEIQEVSGLGNQDPAQGPLNLSVNLKSHDGQLVSWMTRSLEPGLAARLTAEGSLGRATLLMPTEGAAWRLQVTSVDKTRPPIEEEFPQWDGPPRALHRLRECVAGRLQGADWSDACRDLEVADSLTVSLRRARTIPLYHEEHTEEGSFKGIMAVGGCALLLLGFFLLLAFSVVEGFRSTPSRVVQSGGGGVQAVEDEAAGTARLPLIVRLWPVYPFALFLLLQLLRMVFRDSPNRAGRSASSSRRGPPEPSATNTTGGGTSIPPKESR